MVYAGNISSIEKCFNIFIVNENNTETNLFSGTPKKIIMKWSSEEHHFVTGICQMNKFPIKRMKFLSKE